MNGDFRDGYCSVPMSNWPDTRASSAICYLDASVRARSNLTIACRAAVTDLLFDGRRAVGVKATVAGQDTQFLRPRDHPLSWAASTRLRC